MVAWLKALLFVAGGVTAAAGAAYVTGMLDPWLGRSPAVIASLPEAPAQPRPQPEEDAPAASEEVPLPADPETTEKQPRLSAPSFDVVRAEPNGSVLVAGKAPAGATVELLSGETVLGSTTADASGDFVIVLDDTLPAGDYTLTLRATTSENEISLSTETAIVSIPEADDGQVLVMVEEPGAPAELLTVPDAPAVAEEPAQPAEEEQVAAAEEPADEAAGQEVAEAPEAIEEEQVAAAPDTVEEETAADSEADAAEQEVAAAPEEQPAEAAPQPAATHNVVVEAVEIEGDTVFVAGYADPGRTVRVYANALLLGDAIASEAGRFLVEARRELPVGNYVIRADLLSEDGSVLARAAVPFEREPGEAIAAVAVPPEEEAVEEEVAAAPEPEAAPEVAEEEVAAAPEPEAAPEVVEEEVAAAPEPETAPEVVEEEVAAAPEPEAAPEVAEEEVTAAPEPETAPEVVEEEVAAAPEPEAAPEVAEEEVAAAPPAAGEDDVEITAPPLQRVDGSVIIRRGDNLWRISRRVYGKGVRYSTIYLANQDQIRDPNRIWPGQVFTVPRETAEGEEADLGAIAGQAASPEEGATR